MSALAAADIIPEILHEMSGTGLIKAVLFTAAGIVFLKLLDRFVPEHHGDEESPGAMIHIGIISALAIMLHNIIEGMAVYELGADSLRQGVIFAIGVGLHNIPMGMLVYSTLKDETRVKKYTVLFAVMISTFAGGLVMAAAGKLYESYPYRPAYLSDSWNDNLYNFIRACTVYGSSQKLQGICGRHCGRSSDCCGIASV